MVRCSVINCKSDSLMKIDGLSFHSFPNKPEIRNMWIAATNRPNWAPKTSSRICSQHFDCNLIIKKGRKTFLYPDAVPNTITESVNRVSTMMMKSSEATSAETLAGPSNTVLPYSSPEFTPRTLKRKWLKSQEISEQRLKKLKALREKSRRLNKKVADLEHVLTELKSKLLVGEEDCELLSSIDNVNKDFLKKVVHPSTNRKYSPSLRKFALCLHFISPRAYNFVRKTFNSCLPHPSTLRSWYKSVDGSPGFTKESLECIKVLVNRAQAQSKTLFCALSIDEMAIRKHVQWDGKKCVGFVNFGESLEGDSVSVAREALVFMLTAINDSWKIPVGYFLVDSCNGGQKANLVTQCLELLNSCGVKTISLTFDGCPANFAMARSLGCLLEPSNVNNLKTSFNVGDQEIMIMPDPVHMLKLVRNTLGEKRELLNSSGQRIAWNYIVRLHELQQNEGLHLANKLRNQHINFSKQIMKVKLAAQTFSNSVAEAIEFCNKDLCLSEFAGSEATVEFIKNMNILFDVLNSRNFNTYGLKKPIYKNNIREVEIFLNEMETYLTGLKLDNQNILMTNRKVGFFGFLICIKSVKKLCNQYILPEALKFLPIYKLSQDHLECFFSSVRARGGFNNNPTAIQFESAYKRLVVHGEIKNITSGNCIPLEDIKILTFSEIRFEKKINQYTKLSSGSITDTDEFLDCDPIISIDHDYLTDPYKLTIYSKQIITYIAGFIASKLRKVIKCEDCLLALITDKYHGIIARRDKGGLIYPSTDLNRVCEIAEKIFRARSQKGVSFYNEKNLMLKLVLSCFKECTRTNINIFINDHFDSQPFIGNHRTLLIKSVAMHYFEIRIHHGTKQSFEPKSRVRNIHNKLVLFQGQ